MPHLDHTAFVNSCRFERGVGNHTLRASNPRTRVIEMRHDPGGAAFIDESHEWEPERETMVWQDGMKSRPIAVNTPICQKIPDSISQAADFARR